MCIDMTVDGDGGNSCNVLILGHGEKLKRTSRRHPNYMKIVCMDSATRDVQSYVKFMIVSYVYWYNGGGTMESVEIDRNQSLLLDARGRSTSIMGIADGRLTVSTIMAYNFWVR